LNGVKSCKASRYFLKKRTKKLLAIGARRYGKRRARFCRFVQKVALSYQPALLLTDKTEESTSF